MVIELLQQVKAFPLLLSSAHAHWTRRARDSYTFHAPTAPSGRGRRQWGCNGLYACSSRSLSAVLCRRVLLRMPCPSCHVTLSCLRVFTEVLGLYKSAVAEGAVAEGSVAEGAAAVTEGAAGVGVRVHVENTFDRAQGSPRPCDDALPARSPASESELHCVHSRLRLAAHAAGISSLRFAQARHLAAVQAGGDGINE